MTPQITGLRESCLAFCTRIIIRNFVQICDQESVLPVNSDVHLWLTNFIKSRRQIFQRKRSSFINLICSKALMKMFFNQRKMPSSYLTIRDVMSSKKAFRQLVSSSCVFVLARPLMNSNTSKNTKLVVILVQGNQPFFVPQPIWQNSHTNSQWLLRVLNASNFNH